MPSISTTKHTNKYIEPAAVTAALNDIKCLLQHIRELPIEIKLKKRMLNHAIWQVAMVSGDFYGRFRSRDVITKLNEPIQRDHIYEKKKLVEELLSDSPNFDSIIQRSHCCIVTKNEHVALHDKGKGFSGWDRYKAAGIIVWDTLEDKQIT
jgi:hypothetical protein